MVSRLVDYWTWHLNSNLGLAARKDSTVTDEVREKKLDLSGLVLDSFVESLLTQLQKKVRVLTLILQRLMKDRVFSKKRMNLQQHFAYCTPFKSRFWDKTSPFLFFSKRSSAGCELLLR